MPSVCQPRFQGSLLPVPRRENLGKRSSVRTGEFWKVREKRRESCSRHTPNAKMAPRLIEWFSFECRKTKTKVITLANHIGHR